MLFGRVDNSWTRWNGKIYVGCQGEVLYYESGEMLEQAAQRGCGRPVPGGVQGRVGWGPEQPGLVLNVEVGDPAWGGQVGSWWSLRSLPTQAILWFYDDDSLTEHHSNCKIFMFLSWFQGWSFAVNCLEICCLFNNCDCDTLVSLNVITKELHCVVLISYIFILLINDCSGLYCCRKQIHKQPWGSSCPRCVVDWGINSKQEQNQAESEWDTNTQKLLSCSHDKKCYNLEHLKNKPLDISLAQTPSQSSLSNNTKSDLIKDPAIPVSSFRQVSASISRSILTVKALCKLVFPLWYLSFLDNRRSLKVFIKICQSLT